MMRVSAAVAGLVLIASAATVQAQVNGIMLPVPPLPSIGLPLPRLGLPPLEESVAPPSDGREEQRSRRPARRTAAPQVIFVSPIVVAAPTAPAATTNASEKGPADTAPGHARQQTGTLELPASSGGSTFVFVDGYFVGASERVGRWLQLEPGPHTVELRTDGQPPKGVKVRVAAGETLSFDEARGPVIEAATHEPTVVSAASRQPLYVIAGCYAGNVPPAQASLPRGCDPARATTLER